MLIKDMFKSLLTVTSKGVIVVGEGEDSNAKQELEEYVVTRELSKHFREFFDNYKKGIVGETTKTGVWISGFFGSGKIALPENPLLPAGRAKAHRRQACRGLFH